jgi:hypothetical protein
MLNIKTVSFQNKANNKSIRIYSLNYDRITHRKIFKIYTTI